MYETHMVILKIYDTQQNFFTYRLVQEHRLGESPPLPNMAKLLRGGIVSSNVNLYNKHFNLYSYFGYSS